MKISVYQNQQVVATIDVTNLLKDQKVTSALLHQTVLVEGANLRSPHGHSKTRGEVSGGGRKPWKQKGTGRARQSSIRSPIWVGGGISFGPKSDQNFHKKMSQTMRRRAFQMAVVAQLQSHTFQVVDSWKELTPKTRSVSQMLRNLPGTGKNILLLFQVIEPTLVVATRNLPKVHLATVVAVRLTDLLWADTIIASQADFRAFLQRVFGAEADNIQAAPAATPPQTTSKSNTESKPKNPVDHGLKDEQ